MSNLTHNLYNNYAILLNGVGTYNTDCTFLFVKKKTRTTPNKF